MEILIIFSCSFIVLMYILIFILLKLLLKECFLKRKNIQIQNSLDMGNGEIILNALDSIIEDSINTYIILNLGFKDTDYIPEKEQKKMIKEVYNDVIEKISPNFIDQLSLIFSKEYINIEISKRIQLAIMNYIINTNTSFKK